MTPTQSMRRSSLRHTQRGVNLIEIMVAMVIGLFLVMGATTLYVNTRKSSDVDDSIARMQETARYAMSVIETDVRMANNWGLKKDGSNFDNGNSNSNAVTGATASNRYGGMTANSLEPSTGNTCGLGTATNVDRYVEATDSSFPFTTSCPPSPGNASGTADTLIVRRVNSATSAADSNFLQVCSTRTAATIISDSSATCQNGEIHNLSTNIYYINLGSDQSSSFPSLRRKVLVSGKVFNDVEVIPGIEDFQVELGWDNSASDSAGAVRYVSPNALPAGGRIVAVRVWLLVRADQPDFTFTDTRTYSYANRVGYSPNDNFRRLLMSRTFFIRNVTGT